MSETEKTALETNKEKLQAEADKVNGSRSGKGLRVRVGATRGKNPQAISFEAFDLSKNDTLPTSVDEFMNLTGVKTEPEIVSFLIDGYNDAQYTAASDPIAEYVEASWPEDVRKNFRTVIRNYVSMTGVSVEDAVSMIKPQLVKSLAK